jgi:hypothetical protein
VRRSLRSSLQWMSDDCGWLVGHPLSRNADQSET